MTDKELLIIQKTELDILKKVVDICERHNIRYFAAGGTLLGCVRHGGFIPWDDDIDIEIARPDYKKFIACCKKELPDYYGLDNFRLSKKSKLPYLKVVDKRTVLELNYAAKPIKTPVFIDIFPFDGMPKGKVSVLLFKVIVTVLRVLRNYANFDNINISKSNRPFYERFLIWFGGKIKIERFLNLKKILAVTEKYMQRFDYNTSSHYFSVYGSGKFREIVSADVYGEGKKIKFEDMLLNAPVHPDIILTQLYGDYMTPPDEAHRSSGHNTRIIKCNREI